MAGTDGSVAYDPGSPLLSSGGLQLLSSIVGGETNKSGSTSGSSSSSGTSSSSTSSNQTQTGNQTGVQSSTTKNTADVTDLHAILQQQMAGISPELLQSIFAEGSKAAPGLVATMANAVGARSAENTPLATALGTMSSQLVNQALQATLSQRNAAADTAAKIAQLTSGSTTSGSTSSTSTSGTSGTSTTEGATSQTGSQSGTSGENTKTNPNYDNVVKLLGVLFGGSVLNKALPGGISGAVGFAGDTLGGLLKQLLGGNTGGADVPPDVTLPGYDGIATPVSPWTLSDGIVGAEGPKSLDDLLAQLLGGTGSSTPGYTTPSLTTDTPDWWQTEGWDQLDPSVFDQLIGG